MRRCPTCKRELPAANPFGSFCSERCRLVDLGAWLNESYRISSRPSEEDLDQGMTMLDDGNDDNAGDGDGDGDSDDDVHDDLHHSWRH